ncbi:FG-GAP repeat domain-containing protein [Pseudoflavitalea rhizosphaerae]|uniref:FG-GAP repeat domain-containing protein n=1 Tax=Pseudoflavitalea rhizosphaerae TaxID=1884793 RepID=UPI000F8C6CDB|nr:VCBS repeat-containing protein [Pseudoflavitalea rhizosphaerae]
MENKLASLTAQFTNYSITGNGIPEINKLELSFEEDLIPVRHNRPLVLLFLEWRLMNNTTGSAKDNAFRECLQQYRKDLAAAGFDARFITASLYEGPEQKDGLILLALRRFVQAVYREYPPLKGLVLIGQFPDAAIVRRITWAPGFVHPRELALQAGIMCERADLVLGDMQGNWEAIYRNETFTTEDIAARPDEQTSGIEWFRGEDVLTCEFTSTSFVLKQGGPFRDVFFLDDARYQMEKTADHLRIFLFQAENNKETGAPDSFGKNIMARPELAVSRINAWHAAVNPNPSMKGTDGGGFLDPEGNPATVLSHTPLFQGLQEDRLFTHHSPDLEKDLLISYFQRNHSFRMGAFAGHPWRTAIISGSPDFDPDYYLPVISNAATDFQEPVKVYNASLLQYTEFLKAPAVLKYILSHSFNRCSWFNAGGYTHQQLEAAVGGKPFRWTFENGKYTPDFKTKDSAADMFLYRPMWQYKQFENAGASLLIHGGCNVNSVAEVFTHRYTEHAYGHWHNAESILFFTNCVAMLSRAKYFNDKPEYFADTFRQSVTTTFGDCWRSFFERESNNMALSTKNVSRKKAYWWGITGDWTLRLRNRNGLGICSLQPALTPAAILPDHSMIESFTFSNSHQSIAGTGDMDGDGIDEILLRGSEGLAIVKWMNGSFTLLASLAYGSGTGSFTVEAGDKIIGIANFTGQLKTEILVSNNAGFALLALQDGIILSVAQFPNGSLIGNWMVDTTTQHFASTGVFQQQSGTDVVMMGPNGLAILSLKNRQHRCIVPNGSTIGTWILDTAPGKDHIKLIADLNGEGTIELLMANAEKTGVFRFTNGKIHHLSTYPNGIIIGGYAFQSSHHFIADHFFDANTKALLVNDGTALRFFNLINGELRIRTAILRGPVDGWMVEPAINTIQPLGQLHPAHNKALFMIRSGWGIGFIGFNDMTKPVCYSAHAFGSVLNNWHLHHNNQVAAIARLSAHHPKPCLLLTNG